MAHTPDRSGCTGPPQGSIPCANRHPPKGGARFRTGWRLSRPARPGLHWALPIDSGRLRFPWINARDSCRHHRTSDRSPKRILPLSAGSETASSRFPPRWTQEPTCLCGNAARRSTARTVRLAALLASRPLAVLDPQRKRQDRRSSQDRGPEHRARHLCQRLRARSHRREVEATVSGVKKIGSV